MCKTTTPTQMPISAAPMVNATGATADGSAPAPGATDLQSLFGDNATKGPQDQATVNKPTKFGRGLELASGGAYDPTGGEDRTGLSVGSKPTKFGALLSLVRPMVQGAAVGGLLGRSTPGGGFAAANQFFLNQRLRQMQMSEFLLNQMKMQSEITKNAAEAQWAQRRPLLTRTANTIKGKDANGNDIYMSQNANDAQWEPVQGITPEAPGPDYATVPTTSGLVKYDRKGAAPTVPLTIGQPGGDTGTNAGLAAEAGGMSSSAGPTTGTMPRGRVPGAVPSPSAIAASGSKGGPILLQPFAAGKETTPEQQAFDTLMKQPGMTADKAWAQINADKRKPDASEQPLTGQKYNAALAKAQSALNAKFDESEKERTRAIADLDKKKDQLTDDEYQAQRQQIEEDNADRKQRYHEEAATAASEQGINLGTVPDYRSQIGQQPPTTGGIPRKPGTPNKSAQGKVASTDIVQAWAAKQGIPYNQALSQFKQRGYAVQ